MANTTFSGPVRSKNGFSQIAESSTTGALTGTQTLSTYTATVTVANGDTTGKEACYWYARQLPTFRRCGYCYYCGY